MLHYIVLTMSCYITLWSGNLCIVGKYIHIYTLTHAYDVMFRILGLYGFISGFW